MAAVQRWGKTLAVRIPAGLAQQLHMSVGTPVEIVAEQDAMVVRSKLARRYRLRDLLKKCRPSQLHGETDFGPDVGREVLD